MHPWELSLLFDVELFTIRAEWHWRGNRGVAVFSWNLVGTERPFRATRYYALGLN